MPRFRQEINGLLRDNDDQSTLVIKGQLCPGNKKVASGGVPSPKLTSKFALLKDVWLEDDAASFLGKPPIFRGEMAVSFRDAIS